MSEYKRQALRFALIGVASTALYFGLLLLLEPLVASVFVLAAICYACAMGFNFLAQGLFTFQMQSLSSRQMGRYVMMHGGAMLVNSIAMSLLVDSLGLHILIAQVFVTGCIAVATFLLSKAWVFT